MTILPEASLYTKGYSADQTLNKIIYSLNYDLIYFTQHYLVHIIPYTNTFTLQNEAIVTTSSSPTAMESATPEERKGLFPCGTGQGSRCNSPRRSVRFMSIFCTGCKNLQNKILKKPFICG